MVRDDTFRDFDVAVVGHVAGRGLQEEERLLGRRVVQLLDVLGVVAPNGDDLGGLSLVLASLGVLLTFFPVRAKEVAMAEEGREGVTNCPVHRVQIPGVIC